jgi:hypothetical protein
MHLPWIFDLQKQNNKIRCWQGEIDVHKIPDVDNFLIRRRNSKTTVDVVDTAGKRVKKI